MPLLRKDNCRSARIFTDVQGFSVQIFQEIFFHCMYCIFEFSSVVESTISTTLSCISSFSPETKLDIRNPNALLSSSILIFVFNLCKWSTNGCIFEYIPSTFIRMYTYPLCFSVYGLTLHEVSNKKLLQLVSKQSFTQPTPTGP